MFNSFLEFAIALFAVLLLAALSGMVSEKAGVVNIGIEGMMTFGAMMVAIIGASINKEGMAKNNNMQILVILGCSLLTGLFAMLHAFPSITLKSNQVISGTAINILALGLAAFVITYPGLFGENSQGASIKHGYEAIKWGGVFFMWTFVAIVIGIGIFVFFKFTRTGIRYAMVGENPNAIDAAGINVNKYRYWAVFFSGVLAGLAGGIFVISPINVGAFRGTTNGYGFLAMGIMIFGQWKIQWITLGALLFAVLFALASRIGYFDNVSETVKNLKELFKAVPFILTLVVMAIFSKKAKAPAANGVPFDKAKR
ncbi:ABC transporter permease [[Acholeplasma] multilocale]|uniref:ABC transporter permease n=1 Tax=[Acholeplasma] multilocale TaxID=264638 RepID=UPI000551C04D|nr:ABC transporter permease [[Acholeplasma] multilocale]